MKRILVASDLSARSERALRRAFLIAEAKSAELTVLSVVDDELPASAQAKLREATEEELARLCRSIAPLKHRLAVVTGEPVAAIQAEAERLAADLVVLGRHRTRPFWDMFSGTTMERVVRGGRRPVLLVTDSADHAYRSVLCGIDLSPAAAAAARTAADLAPGAVFHSFHAVHVPYRGLVAPGPDAHALEPFLAEARRELAAWWDGTDLPPALPRPEPEVASVTQAFETAKAAHDPDLLAIGAHGRPMLAPSLLGAFTEEILRDPPCDVLVQRAETGARGRT